MAWEEWQRVATPEQIKKIREFVEEHNATVTGFMRLAGDVLSVYYSVPRSPRGEETAEHLPEWADVIYGPHGGQKFFDSSWDCRRRIRQKSQAILTGSLKIEREGVHVEEDGKQYMVFR